LTDEETEYGRISKQRWGQVKYEFHSLLKRKYFVLLVFLLLPLIVSLLLYGNLALVGVASSAIAVLVLLIQNSDLFKYLLTSSEVKKIREKIFSCVMKPA
jgi:hypothetical protein